MHQANMQDMVEVKHEETVKVPTYFDYLAQSLSIPVRQDPTIRFIQVAVCNPAIGLLFKCPNKGLNMIGIIQVIIIEVSNVFTLCLGKCFVKRKGLASVLLPVDKG